MNAWEMAGLAALVDRIDELLHQFVEEDLARAVTVLRAELLEATDKLKQVALSFQN
jgi:hypothetical protein